MASALRNQGSTTRWRTIRQAILIRDGYQCRIRGPHCTGRATCVDHIRRREDGGDDQAHNLRASCNKCNLTRGQRNGNEKTPLENRW